MKIADLRDLQWESREVHKTILWVFGKGGNFKRKCLGLVMTQFIIFHNLANGLPTQFT